MAEVKIAAISDEIQRVVHEIVARFRPKKIILFGSYAYGKPAEGSDLDFLVVMSQPLSNREAWEIAYDLEQNLPLQIIFMSLEEFEETKDVVGGLAYPAHHWGKVLYEQKA